MAHARLPAFSSDKITSTWLSTILAETVHINKIQPLSSGYIADVFRVHLKTALTTTDGQSVIVKMASQVPSKRRLANQFNSYQREHKFYKNIAPELALNTPQCYYNHFQLAPLSLCLVLEDVNYDLPGSGNQPFPQIKNHAVLKHLAALHKSHWNQGKGLPAFIDNLDQIGASYNKVFRRQHVLSTNLLSNFSMQVIEHYIDQGPPVQPPHPSTLIHVDFKPDNFSLKNHLTVFDWGDYCFGPPAFDLAYFMMHRPARPDLTLERDLNLLKTYHNALLELDILDYTKEKLQEDFREILPLLAYTPLALLDMDPADASKKHQLSSSLWQLGQMIDRHC
jgi:hypothetical protein